MKKKQNLARLEADFEKLEIMQDNTPKRIYQTNKNRNVCMKNSSGKVKEGLDPRNIVNGKDQLVNTPNNNGKAAQTMPNQSLRVISPKKYLSLKT